MDEQNRVFRFADLPVPARLVQIMLFGLELYFPLAYGNNLSEGDQVRRRQPTEHQPDRAELYPQLDGRAVYADYPVPENNEFKQKAKCRASGEHRNGGRYNHHAEPDVP